MHLRFAAVAFLAGVALVIGSVSPFGQIPANAQEPGETPEPTPVDTPITASEETENGAESAGVLLLLVRSLGSPEENEAPDLGRCVLEHVLTSLEIEPSVIGSSAMSEGELIGPSCDLLTSLLGSLTGTTPSPDSGSGDPDGTGPESNGSDSSPDGTASEDATNGDEEGPDNGNDDTQGTNGLGDSDANGDEIASSPIAALLNSLINRNNQNGQNGQNGDLDETEDGPSQAVDDGDEDASEGRELSVIVIPVDEDGNAGLPDTGHESATGVNGDDQSTAPNAEAAEEECTLQSVIEESGVTVPMVETAEDGSLQGAANVPHLVLPPDACAFLLALLQQFGVPPEPAQQGESLPPAPPILGTPVPSPEGDEEGDQDAEP